MKPHLLLLHGWAYDSHCFDWIRPLLAPSFTLHTPDLEPIWENRIKELSTLINTTRGEWFGCGWSMGYLITRELHSSGLLTKNCGIAALPSFTEKNGLNSQTISGMLQGLETGGQEVLRRFSLWCAYPSRPKQLPSGGAKEYLRSSLRYLCEAGDITRQPCGPVLLAGKDTLLPLAASQAFPDLATTLLPDAGHDLPLSAPEKVASWLLATLL